MTSAETFAHNGEPVLDDREFDAFRDLIFRATGISLGAGKRQLVAARFGKRLRALELNEFSEYLALLRSDKASSEREFMINAITTNKTDFFREPHHFDTLANLFKTAAGSPVRIWSAGCSTGEEPYTIAMTAREALGDTAPGLILTASDVDTAVLAHAANGTYADDRMSGVNEARRRHHFLCGRGQAAGQWRIKPDIRAMIDFRRINFIDASWDISKQLDVIFCRNVIIYFNRATQERLISRFAEHLRPGGLLILGHSENLHWLSDTFESLGNTVYRLRASVTRTNKAQVVASNRIPANHALGRPMTGVPARISAGQIYASRIPATVTTILGSCVSVCLRDPIAGVGGMNHFALASGEGGDPARYGTQAMQMLVRSIVEHGGSRHRLEAKVFGACHVLDFSHDAKSVCEQNATFIRQYLLEQNIPVLVERLGGDLPLEVCFETHTGRARIRSLPATAYKSSCNRPRVASTNDTN